MACTLLSSLEVTKSVNACTPAYAQQGSQQGYGKWAVVGKAYQVMHPHCVLLARAGAHPIAVLRVEGVWVCNVLPCFMLLIIDCSGGIFCTGRCASIQQVSPCVHPTQPAARTPTLLPLQVFGQATPAAGLQPSQAVQLGEDELHTPLHQADLQAGTRAQSRTELSCISVGPKCSAPAFYPPAGAGAATGRQGWEAHEAAWGQGPSGGAAGWHPLLSASASPSPRPEPMPPPPPPLG
jgi:hypothetical protein